MTNGLIAVILAYLLGSVPAAYIVTRWRTGKDIRKLGGGNAGTRNVFHEVGRTAGAAVAVFDIAKGAVAVLLVWWLSGRPPMHPVQLSTAFVLLAGVAVVAGHIWSIFLKFGGGNGLATAIGVLSILMTGELLIALALTLLLTVITRNVVLSVNISLLTVPLTAWRLFERSWLFLVFTIVLLVMMILHFLPVARESFAKAGNKENFLAELLRWNQAKKGAG